MSIKYTPDQGDERSMMLVQSTSEVLHAFLDAAAGEGLVLGGVDAADLYIAIFPERYAKAIAGLDVGTGAAPVPQPEPTSKGEKLALMPYEPTEAMRWAAKNLDPVLTHDNIRALWSAMWVAAYRSQQREPQEAAEMTEEAVRLWLAQRGRMSVPRSDYLKAIAPASLREAQIQAVASAVDACEERGCKECAGMLRGEIHRLRAWDFKDSRSAPKEASKVEPVADETVAWQERQQTKDGWTDWYNVKDPGFCEISGGIKYQWRSLYLRPSQQALSDAKDAERYRWLRDKASWVQFARSTPNYGRWHAEQGQLDKTIDSAILAAAGGSEK